MRLFYAFGLLHVVLSACSLFDIPEVGTVQRCDHETGCIKQPQNCLTDSNTCDVVCAAVPNGTKERWNCVDDVWELTGARVTCPLRPCPPFPAVVPSRCATPVTLGYVVNRQLTTCVQTKGCSADQNLYAQGQLFKEQKACQMRLRVCQQQQKQQQQKQLQSQEPTPPPSPQPTQEPTPQPTPQPSPQQQSEQPQQQQQRPQQQQQQQPPRQTPQFRNTPTPTIAPAGKRPFIDPASRRAAEIAARALSAGTVAPLQPLIQGAWGAPGVDVDIALQALGRLNPTFNFTKTHEFEQYPFVTSDHFARLLFDSQNLLVRILRS